MRLCLCGVAAHDLTPANSQLVRKRRVLLRVFAWVLKLLRKTGPFAHSCIYPYITLPIVRILQYAYTGQGKF